MNSPATPNPVSLELERLLQERGITHAELARRLGVSRPAVSRMLSPGYEGHSLPSLRRIAEALGVQLEVNFLESDGSAKRHDVQRVASRWRTHKDAPDVKPPRTQEDYAALRQLQDDFHERFSGATLTLYTDLLEQIEVCCEGWLDEQPLLIKQN